MERQKQVEKLKIMLMGGIMLGIQIHKNNNDTIVSRHRKEISTMKKRNIIIFAVTITIFAIVIIVSTIITNILKIPEEEMYLVVWGILVIIMLYLIFLLLKLYNKYRVHKLYKTLIENEKKIKTIEDEKHKTYFVLDSRKEIEDKIRQYDEMLEVAYNTSNICIQSLKDFKEFLSKKKYANVIEIEEQIRKTSRE